MLLLLLLFTNSWSFSSPNSDKIFYDDFHSIVSYYDFFHTFGLIGRSLPRGHQVRTVIIMIEPLHGKYAQTTCATEVSISTYSALPDRYKIFKNL